MNALERHKGIKDYEWFIKFFEERIKIIDFNLKADIYPDDKISSLEEIREMYLKEIKTYKQIIVEKLKGSR